MMRIHLQVAFAPQGQIDHRMLGEKRQHVIEERDAGFDRRLAFTVDDQLQRDLRFLRDALDLRGADLHVC